MKEIVNLAPAFMCILRGCEHVFEMCNDKYFQIVGNRDILNLPIRQALPELEGQGFFELLDRVFATGRPYSGSEVPVRLQRTPGAALEEVFIDFVYMPLRESDGAISGIFVHGVDVTEQVFVPQAFGTACPRGTTGGPGTRTIRTRTWTSLPPSPRTTFRSRCGR